VAVVRCDRQAGLLYAGTNRSIYVSFDDGERWQPLNGFATSGSRPAATPRRSDLVATHRASGCWTT
jgi:hypothetical protein